MFSVLVKSRSTASCTGFLRKIGVVNNLAPKQQLRQTTIQTKRWSSLASANTTTTSTAAAAAMTTAGREMEGFMSVFPHVLKDITETIAPYDDTNASEWLARAVLYNVPKGKRNRGLFTVAAYQSLMMATDSEIDATNLRRSRYLGWCVEVLQAVFLIADDIMDHSETRRGAPCWYKVADVGMIAINDSLMLENAMFALLRQHFAGEPYYVPLLELFHEAMLVTTVGESLDLQMALLRVGDFTMERYSAIVRNKTAFYSFYLPIAAAMRMAGFTDAKQFGQAKAILYEIGHYFQVQDDFLDCFGDPGVTGKIGTDIQDNKCTWLAAQCMSLATEDQRTVMQECYGQVEAEKVEMVKRLYEKLNLAQMFAAYEEESYRLIKERIEALPHGIPHGIFYETMEKIYRRDH